MEEVSFAILCVVAMVTCNENDVSNTLPRPDPKIITKDGNLKFQSATNRNISFHLSGNSDVLIGETSLKELIKTIEEQKSEIELLKQKSSICSSKKDLCLNNGVCIETSQTKTGYKCICQLGFTGDQCGIQSIPNPCGTWKCFNKGKCITQNGMPYCVCYGNWFGTACQIPKPNVCNYTIEESAGIISSPGYPEAYPSNLSCAWKLNAQPGKLIQIIVMATSIGLSPVCGKTDYLQISDGGSSNDIATLCGNVPSQTHYTLSSETLIKFVSGSTPIGRGFSIFFNEIENTLCGGRLTTASGKFQSLSYPESSSKPLHCIWVVDLKSKEKLQIDFESIILNNPGKSCVNYLEIRKGDSHNSKVYAKICENKQHVSYQITWSKFFIKFVSTGTEQSRFSGFYDTLCGGMLNVVSGYNQIITSPFYPNAYAKKKVCTWNILSPEKTTVTLRFLDFAVEPHPSCSYDSISIFNGNTTSAPLLGRYCGNKVPLPVASSMNFMTIVFNTDGDGDFKGFKTQISAIEEGCSGLSSGMKGSIESPGYPSFYPVNSECIYTISSSKAGYIIQLLFTVFELEIDNFCKNDFVQIFDGQSTTSPVLLNNHVTQGRICGHRFIPVIFSSGATLTVKFKSNADSVNTGFVANWIAIPDTQGCDVHTQTATGAINSPGYPNPYGTHLNCKYTIVALDGHLIMLKFGVFNLEKSVDCKHDSLKIYDGDNVTSPLVGTFCGQHSPGNILSSGNYLFMVFTTDIFGNDKGFAAKYKTGTNYCGGYLHGESGFILSPGYPQYYKTSQQCEWVIKAAEGNTIELTIEIFELQASKSCSENDYLQIYDGENFKYPKLAELCGNVTSKKMYISTGRTMNLKFNSDETVMSKGFKLSYRSGCGGILNAQNGIIESPNYPNNYPFNRVCNWTINGNRRDKIRLDFVDFNIESSTGCSSDFLKIYELTKTHGLFCGPNRPSLPIISESTQLKLTFKSDGANSMDGFKISYHLIGCSKDFTASQGQFHTPNYPKLYPRKSYCQWRIRVKEGMRIQLNFSEINLESDCAFDNVTVYNGYSNEHPIIGHYCSKRKPVSISSSSNELIVVFMSDATTNGRGFAASYRAVEGGCGGIIRAHSGSIQSPGYPNTYPINTDCKWLIILPNVTHNIDLTFSSFDIESTSVNIQCKYDHVKIYDGNLLIGTYCGKSLPDPFLSTTNELTLILRSDSASTGKGFQAHFKTGCGGTVDIDSAAASGFISTPHYPRFYTTTDCVWILKTSLEKKVTLTFVDFDTEECLNCVCDFAEIHNGDNKNSSLRGRYCGPTVPPSITSNGHSLYVRFQANKFDHHTGFKAKYTSLSAACGGRLTGWEGRIASPLFPYAAPNVTDCIWTIEVSVGSLITFTFEAFNIVSSTGCVDAYVEVYDGPTTNSLSKSKSCGTLRPTTIRSTSNIITVRFYSNSQTSSAGFRATYLTYCQPVHLTSPNGYINSPNYPRLYPDNIVCAWRIIAPVGTTIMAEFEEFDLEEKSVSGICNGDFVRIFDGIRLSTTIGTWCGITHPSVILSNTNYLTIGFRSDVSVHGTGFRLKYSTYVTECGDILTGSYNLQYIQSVNYPKNYPTNKECKWEINAPAGHSVRLRFEDFDIEEDPICDYDYVELSEQVLNSQHVIAKLCGMSALNKTYSSSGTKLFVHFKSDQSSTHRGFKASYHTGCGGELRSTKGIIQSTKILNSTKTYPPNQNCTWKIIIGPGSVIKINFIKFALESSINCTNDYVLIRNGISSDSPVIGRFCGSQLPKQVISSGYEVLIQFISDSQKNVASGFKLVYERSILGCGGKQSLSDNSLTYELTSPGFPLSYPVNTECEWALYVPSGFVVEFTINSFNLSYSRLCSQDYLYIRSGTSASNSRYCGDTLKENYFVSSSNVLYVKFHSTRRTEHNKSSGFKATWKIGCGRTFLSESGMFSSPLYPSLYQNNSDCVYKITLPSKKQVHLAFNTFSLQENTQCLKTTGDYVEVTNGDVKGALIGRYCGSRLPTPIVSLFESIYVHFHSDASGNSNGFQASFSTVGQECGGKLVFSGTFQSPFYPSHYSFNRVCTWVLRSLLGQAVQLNFTNFDMEKSKNCTNDYIEIRNGQSSTSPLLGRFCGNNTPPLIYSGGSYLNVKFVSDRNNKRGTGFRALFDSSHVGCAWKLTGSSGNFTSPRYPSNYPLNLECIWILTVPEDKTIHLTIHDTDIEPFRDCSFDYLEIRDGFIKLAPLVKKLCGNTTGYTYSSAGSSLYVKFYSNRAGTYKGFSASWKEGEPLCGGEFNLLSGEVQSPKLTGKALDCVWKFNRPTGMLVTLKFIQFELLPSTNCSIDKLVIHNGQNPDSPVLTTLCGPFSSLKGKTFTSSSNHMRVHLVATGNHSTVPVAGFKLQYLSKESGCGGLLKSHKGVITSPKYPATYSNNLECEWIIKVDIGSHVFIHVDDLDIEDSHRCTHDFVELQDGPTVQSKSIARLCGHTHNSVYTSSSNFMYIRMKTNHLAVGKGFRFQYNTGCGGLLKGSSGFVQTPGYPKPYPPNQDCPWIIDLPSNYHIRLTKATINLPPHDKNGQCLDYVQLRNGLTISSPLVATFCGKINLPVYDSSYHQMFLHFVSDNSTNSYSGAKGHYEAVCGEHIKNKLSGTIQFPLDGRYHSNQTCEWIIEFPFGKKITITTKSFDLELGGSTCIYDYLEIRDGKTNNSALFGKFCGSAKPPPFQSTTNFVYIKFASDSSTTKGGFQLEYSQSPLTCGGVISGKSGGFVSPGFPSSYPVNQDCGWRITTLENYQINLTFSNFNIISIHPRLCDSYITIYDSAHPRDVYRRTRALCGRTAPLPIISFGNSLYIKFHSESILVGDGFGDGFIANYTSSNTLRECGGLIKISATTGGILTSPNYDTQFSVGSDCVWLLETDPKTQVAILIKDLNLPPKQNGKCNSSQLVIEDGFFAPQKHILCGSISLLQFHSSENLLKVTLKRTVAAKGFNLTYTQNNCSNKYTKPSGLITSPNYPLNYPPKSICTYLIQAPAGENITLYFAFLDIEFHQKCVYDYLAIHDGNSDKSKLIKNQKWCGTISPPTMKSTGNELFMQFVTDESVTYRGFALSYTTASGSCGNMTITGSSGAITSPNYPSFYKQQYHCEWTIVATSGRKIQFNVKLFETEPPSNGADCTTADYLELIDGVNDPWGKFCGLTHPAGRTTTSNEMKIKFISNGVNNDYRGFQLIYKEV